MITPELITYIRKQLEAGVPKEEITKVLAPNGWSPQDISKAFSSIATSGAFSPVNQKIISPTLTTRKILLSAGLVVASGLYTFFQYTANSPRTSAIVAYVPLPNQNASVSSPGTDILTSPSATATVEQRPPTNTSAVQPTSHTIVVATPNPIDKSVSIPVAVSKPAPAPIPAPKRKGQFADGTYRGKSADAYYGMVQVNAVIKNGALADVQILQYPNDRNTSVRINSEALPILKQEAIAAQSANIDAVSGASDTSPAFVASLSSALAQAKN